MDYYAARRDALRRSLAEEGIDALIISSVINVTYLTGFRGDSSVLLLTPKKAILVSDPRYTVQIAEECPGLECHIRTTAQKILEAVGEVLAKLGVKTVGIESGYVTLADFEALKSLLPSFEWKPASDRVERLRTIKDPSEIAQIREAIGMAEPRVYRAAIAASPRRPGKRPLRRYGQLFTASWGDRFVVSADHRRR